VDLFLGAYPNTRRRTVEVPLTHDSLMLFYTDGLIERPLDPSTKVSSFSLAH
jgi:serine phosphatase RsbU (regulator of sigma subunit)